MGFSSFKNFAYQVAIPQKIIPITQTKQPYDVINTQDLFIYYSFNNGTFNSAGVGNYATGIGKVDSSFSGSNVVIENQTLKLPAGNNGLKINEVIPTSSSTGFTVAFYFKLNTYGNYNFFFTLQGNTSDERYYICLDANSNKFLLIILYCQIIL